MSDTSNIGALPFAAAEPFGMGRVVALTFAIIGRNPLAIIGVGLVVALLSSAADIGIAALGANLFGDRTGVTAFNKVISVGLGFVLGGIGTGAITHVALRDIDGRRIGIGPALLTGLRLTLPLAGLGFVMGIGIGVASILFLVPGLMLALRWAVATPVRVAEGPGISSAMARSAVLTEGHRWALLGLTVAFVLLVGIAAVLIGMLVDRGGPGSPVATLTFIAEVLVSTLSSTLLSTGIAACYAELRRTKEGTTPDQLAAIFA